MLFALAFLFLFSIGGFSGLMLAIVPVFAVWALGGLILGTVSFAMIGLALACATALFGLGAIAFAIGVLGGGDVKLLAASSLFAGPALMPDFLMVTSLAGGVLGLAVLVGAPIGPVAPAGHATIRLRLRGGLPYGPAIAAGGLIEFGCALVNLAGVDFSNFLIANILVGMGWNFTYIGGSTLLTTTYTPAERAKTQASHDFAVYAATATAAAVSGVLAAKAGWAVINIAALPLMAAVTGAAVWLMVHNRRRAEATAPAE